MIGFDVQIDTKDLERDLQSLPEKLARKWLRKGVLEGAKFLRDRVRQGAPIRREGVRGKYFAKSGDQRIRYAGFLRRNIGAKYAKERSSKFDVRYHVRPIGYAFYGFFVEGGHRAGKRSSTNRKSTAAARSVVPPHPFMEPVFRNAANEVIARMKTVIQQGAYYEWASTGFQGLK